MENDLDPCGDGPHLSVDILDADELAWKLVQLWQIQGRACLILRIDLFAT